MPNETSDFEFEDIPQSAEERSMQKSKEASFKKSEKDVLKSEEKQEDKEHKEELSGYTSLFYPPIQAIQDYMLKEADILPASKDERAALNKAIIDVEIKYKANKINTPEGRAVSAFITPFAKDYKKLISLITDKVNLYRNKNIKEGTVQGAFNGADKPK